MAQLLVRNLPDDVKTRLKERARRHGSSLEQEARDVLTAAAYVAEPEVGFGTWASSLFKDFGLEEGEELQSLPPSYPHPAVFED
jgi:plasmid stability protein